MVSHPETLDVILASNLFGDILTAPLRLDGNRITQDRRCKEELERGDYGERLAGRGLDSGGAR